MEAKRNVLVGLCVVVALGLCAIAKAGPGEAESKKVVADAYKLRMEGKVDDANALLERAIQENPHNAAAYYELARIKVHMAVGNPRDMKGLMEKIEDARQSIIKAIENDPNNVIYPFFEGGIALLQAYPSLMGNQPDAKENVAKVCGAFETSLKLKPDYRQAMLYLVEIYGTLPEDKGGDKAKAEQYAKKLEGIDKVFGAKARSILANRADTMFLEQKPLLPGEVNRIDYWKNVLKNNDGNADVLEELGKAYLGADNVNDAALCFEKAAKINPEKSLLFLDLSIYHTWAAMRAGNDSELLHKAIAAGDAAVTRYLEFKPVLPMRAYALGVQYKYKSHSGEKEQADKLLKEAEALDHYFSKATGAPNPDLFIPPDEISHNHRYFFRPIQ